MSLDDVDAIIAASPMANFANLRWRAGPPTVASPMRQAVDADNAVIEADGLEPVFLKSYHQDGIEPVDLEAAAAATQAAALLGLGPRLRFVLPNHRALAVDHLGPLWRPAMLHDLAEPAIFERIIAAKRAFHGAPALARRYDVFARTEALAARAHADGVTLPTDVEALLGWSRAAAAAISAAGCGQAPCHNDGSASAFMVDPDGRVMLVDFDEAGQNDPFFDLALLLNEASSFGDLWAQGIEVYLGAAESRLVNRCRIYAVADDVHRGLWGWMMSATSPRRGVEFLKYGEWRLLRARSALREPDFAARLDAV